MADIKTQRIKTLTFTYNIFGDIGAGNPLLGRSKESTLHLEKIDDPEY